MPGPAPKKSDQRRRTNPTAGEARMAGATAVDAVEVNPPDPDGSWHPVARVWFESLSESGQAVFYQASDWGQAFVMAEAISRELKPQPLLVGRGDDASVEFVEMPMKGATLSAFLKGCTDLLVSEAARRRAAVELKRPTPTEESPAASVSSLAAWRNASG